MARYIISGGGTGGHIFPAIAIADALRASDPDAQILFVGAEGKMEMERVPKAGYEIIGLPIRGIQRKLTLKNLAVPFRLLQSLWKANRVIRKFKPEIAIGVGGYASGPLLRIASWKGVPTLVQEQNSYPGITNKLLAAKAKAICVAYDGMERFFPAERIHLTGNPVRSHITAAPVEQDVAKAEFGLKSDRPTILLIGGSLGARTMNEAMLQHVEELINQGYSVIWQTGKSYYERMAEQVSVKDATKLHLTRFIDKMDLAYAAADVILSRAGALSISELCVIAKPTILVPSPNVSEDHQTKNAMSLVDKGAAIMIRDAEVKERLNEVLQSLRSDESVKAKLAEQIASLAIPDAAERIRLEIEKIVSP